MVYVSAVLTATPTFSALLVSPCSLSLSLSSPCSCVSCLLSLLPHLRNYVVDDGLNLGEGRHRARGRKVGGREREEGKARKNRVREGGREGGRGREGGAIKYRM